MVESIHIAIRRLLAATPHGPIFDDPRDLLGQSLFYYCSGKDPTPIAAFGARIPLYVYADSPAGHPNDFDEELRELYSRLDKLNFRRVDRLRLPILDAPDLRRVEVSRRETEAGEYFLLLYVKADGEEGYCCLYRDGENYIQPKYVCNYRYENIRLGVLKAVEKRAQFILGHCFNDKYRCVARYEYLGDYGSEETVNLYQRLHYYVY